MRARRDLTVKRKAGRVVMAHGVGGAAPVRGDFARPHLPKHWSPRDDAEEHARIAEFLRMMEELEANGIRFNLFW